MWERYLYDRVQAVVRGDLTVRCYRKAWQLPRTEPFLSVVGDKVTVCFCRGPEDPSRLVVWIDGREYTVTAVAPVPDDAGDFKALPKSRREALLERIYDQDLGDFQAVDGIRTDTSA